MSPTNQRNKAAARAYWETCDTAPVADLTVQLAAQLAPDATWQGFAPVPDVSGAEAIAETYLVPLRTAFPGLKRDIHIVMGGVSDGKADDSPDGAYWVGGTGYLTGVQVADVWGIPARNRHLRMRWGEFLEFDADGKITRIQILIDQIDWLEQIGLSPLPTPRGAPFVYPAPTGLDGQMWEEQNTPDDLMAFSKQFIWGGLNGFDQNDLKSMGMADYFHPNLKWYGPGGIGACLSFKEFEVLHQAPWLVAFPDRKVGDLDNLIVEGDMVGASSLPGVWLTHTGTYLGFTASGKRAGVNGIDFWRYENGQFTENWVFVDMIHFFGQFGIDLMARVARLAETG